MYTDIELLCFYIIARNKHSSDIINDRHSSKLYNTDTPRINSYSYYQLAAKRGKPFFYMAFACCIDVYV